jgi:hypothetical protein
MDRLRPKALTAEQKQILKAYGFDLINKNTEITNPTLLAELYRKTRSVLEFHHRAGIVEYLLFKNRDPVLMTKAGAFIAISNRALKLAKDDEALSGIIAHELSHEYFAMQFLRAHNSHDYETLRIIEMMCDALATITLLKLEMNPDKYSAALEKIICNSEASEQLNNGSREMPSLQSRLHVIAEIKKQFCQQAASPLSCTNDARGRSVRTVASGRFIRKAKGTSNSATGKICQYNESLCQ